MTRSTYLTQTYFLKNESVKSLVELRTAGNLPQTLAFRLLAADAREREHQLTDLSARAREVTADP